MVVRNPEAERTHRDARAPLSAIRAAQEARKAHDLAEEKKAAAEKAAAEKAAAEEAAAEEAAAQKAAAEDDPSRGA